MQDGILKKVLVVFQSYETLYYNILKFSFVWSSILNSRLESIGWPIAGYITYL